MRRRTPAGDERRSASHSYPIFLRHYALEVFCVPHRFFGMERRDLYGITTELLPPWQLFLLHFHDHLDFHWDIHRQLLHTYRRARMPPLLTIEGD